MRRNALIGIGVLTVVLVALMAFMLAPRKRGPVMQFADWTSVVYEFKGGEWGQPGESIPSTVIDVGVLKNVPYSSWRAGDYEMNIYGDGVVPACIEIGVYGEAAKDRKAQQRCRAFMSSIVESQGAKAIIERLRAQGESIEAEGFTFEATPPDAPDAYGGWWISVYNTKALDSARASDAEMKVLAVTLPELPTTSSNIGPDIAGASGGVGAGSANGATSALIPAPPATGAAQGTAAMASEAAIARSPASGPTGADNSGWTASQIAMARSSSVEHTRVSGQSSFSPPVSTGTKTVYVSGYTRKNGTYVAPYMRSAPKK
jgi:hypothetical protein